MLKSMKDEIREITEEMFKEAKRQRQGLHNSSSTTSSTMSTPSDTIRGFKDGL